MLLNDELEKSMLKTAVQFNDFCYGNGGASRTAIDTAVGLAEDGIAVKFLGAVGPVCEELRHPLIEVTSLNQSELLDVAKKPSVALQGLWNPAAAKAAREILAACDPRTTVVHVHGWTKALTTAPVREVMRAGFSSVLTLHDFFAACPNGAFYDYRAQRCCKLRALSRECIATHCDKRSLGHKAYRVVRGLVQAKVGHFPLGIRNHIASSARTFDLMRPYLPADARLFPLESAVLVERREPVRVKANRRIVAVGRLEPEKGVELLIEASRRAGVPITFIGDGPLRRVVESNSHCEVTGWKNSTEVFELLSTARALVFASLWYETYGLVVGEASALGVPSIVSDVSAAAERVAHGRSGWVFRSGDAEELSRCLQGVADDDAVERMGRAAYDRFWSNAPTRARYTRELREIYQQILAPAEDFGAQQTAQ